jgi:hypothetical protein
VKLHDAKVEHGEEQAAGQNPNQIKPGPPEHHQHNQGAGQRKRQKRGGYRIGVEIPIEGKREDHSVQQRRQAELDRDLAVDGAGLRWICVIAHEWLRACPTNSSHSRV